MRYTRRARLQADATRAQPGAPVVTDGKRRASAAVACDGERERRVRDPSSSLGAAPARGYKAAPGTGAAPDPCAEMIATLAAAGAP